MLLGWQSHFWHGVLRDSTPQTFRPHFLFGWRRTVGNLEEADGKPFLLQGDTAWSLMVQLSKEETEEYLENRRQKGFNAILVNLIEYFYADQPPENKNGAVPFTTPEDLSTPNDDYFAHADWVIQKAGEKGILVVLILVTRDFRQTSKRPVMVGYRPYWPVGQRMRPLWAFLRPAF